MHSNNQINYVEFPAVNLAATRAFFEAVFNWQFEDFGPDYTAFSNQGVEGGFFRSEMATASSSCGALVILYSDELTVVEARIIEAGGSIIKPVFDFPGGWRFHFTEPSGNELAVWSDVKPQEPVKSQARAFNNNPVNP